VVVGAAEETVGSYSMAGHVYVFTTSGKLMRTLTSPNAQTDGLFGISVSTDGSHVVVGAAEETVGSYSMAGHVYVFTTSGKLMRTLTSPNAQTGGFFGCSVSAEGSHVVVGAVGETVGSNSTAGHVYVFTASGELMSTLTSPNAQAGGRFGYSVSTDGSRVVVGAVDEAVDSYSAAGHAYVFTTSGELMSTLTSPNAQAGGEFGHSVSAEGSYVVVGAEGETVGSYTGAGHVYVFTTSGKLMRTLTSPNAQTGGWFGYSVSTDGSHVVVGAAEETVGSYTGAGHVYVFTTSGKLMRTLTSPNAQTDGFFGWSVSAAVTWLWVLDGSYVVVGAVGETVGAGHAYVFKRSVW
jgi:WD40 repeat protein